MEKIVEPFTSRVGEKITNSLDFSDNEQALKRNFKLLIGKVSCVETKVKKAQVLGKKRRPLEVEDWLGEVEKFKEEYVQLNNRLEEAGYFKSLRYGDRVKKLKEGAEELINQSDAFGEFVLDACETSRERLFTTKLHGEELKQELDYILAWLKTDSNQVPCIGIYGMGGVGKTTLAKHIYKHIYTYLQGTHDKFYVYWVTISQEADINKLQHDLAKELNFVLLKDDDLEVKAANLHRLLREKKNVVIILDNVWNCFDLREIGIPLEMNGCKVIITSRLQDVCNQMHCKKIIKVQPLSEEETWELFLEKLDYVNKLSPEVEEVAKKMAKKCDGLPLAIITVARSMIGVDDIHEWRDALEELSQSIMGRNDIRDKVLPVLLYSYNRLRDMRLQKCFLYCSMYPEDYEISRVELINLFVSEEVMHKRVTKMAEFDQGRTILNKLVNSCLLENVVHDEEEKWGVKMHDLLREMAIEITRNKPRYMIKAGLQRNELPDKQEWTEDLDKASLMANKISKISEGLSPRCPHLSTLILSFNPLKLIPDSFFAYMCGLRVLNLTCTCIENLPDSISMLGNLTALLLGGCYTLCYVPSLRKLKALTELDLSETKIKKLPDGMECLVKLKCLNMRRMKELVAIPSGFLSQFSDLQRLFLPYHIKVQAEEIASLIMLEEFVGWADIVCNSNWFNKSPPLTYYHIIAGDNNYGVNLTRYNYTIGLNEYSFNKQGLDVQLLLQNIQCLRIEKCMGLGGSLFDAFPSLSNYKDFKGCSIKKCDEIESIVRIPSCCTDNRALQNLEDLTLLDLPNFIGLIKWEPRALAVHPRYTFSSLKILTIVGCQKIKKLFSGNLLVQYLQNLGNIFVARCDQMAEIFADDEEDEGMNMGSTSCSSLSINNNKYNPTNDIALPKLRRIALQSLPELENIYKGTINCCDSIEEIEIENCEKLKRLPFFHPSIDGNPPPPSPSPSYSSCSSSSYSNNGTITSIFLKLRILSLCNLPELKSICNGIMICDSINSIIIKGCIQLGELPLFLPPINGEPSPPPSLKHIYIREKEIDWWESLEGGYFNSRNVLRPLLSYLKY